MSHQFHKSHLRSKRGDYIECVHPGVIILGAILEFYLRKSRFSLWIRMLWALKNPRVKKSPIVLQINLVYMKTFHITPFIIHEISVLCHPCSEIQWNRKNLGHTVRQPRIEIPTLPMPRGFCLDNFLNCAECWWNDCEMSVPASQGYT